MSFHIILIDNTRNKVIAAIADKRIGRASFDNDGKVDLKTWELVHDNSCKIVRITNSLFLTGCKTVRIKNRIEEKILKTNLLKASDVILSVKAIDRLTRVVEQTLVYDTPTIFGIYDDGTPFFWNGENDGTDCLEFVPPGNFKIQMAGGVENTQALVGEYAHRLMSTEIDIKVFLKNLIKYASDIDHVVSPTFDLIAHNFN